MSGLASGALGPMLRGRDASSWARAAIGLEWVTIDPVRAGIAPACLTTATISGWLADPGRIPDTALARAGEEAGSATTGGAAGGGLDSAGEVPAGLVGSAGVA
jgi:hypothetical protein